MMAFTIPYVSHIDRPTLAKIPQIHPRCNLGNFIESTRAVSGSATAIIDISGDEEIVLTYDALEEMIQRAVGAFRALGVKRGSKVAIGLPNTSLFVVAFLSLMRLGAIPVFLNPRLSIDTIRFILEDSMSEGILADLDDVPALASLSTVPRLRFCLARDADAPARWQPWAPLFAAAQRDATVETMDFDEQAFQPYTAGSTGTPKGIILTHGGMLWGIEHSETYWPRRAGERGIVAAPMFHKNAMRGTIKPMLRGGCSVVVMRSFRPREFLEAVSRYHVTICGGVPAMFADILREEDLIVSGDYSSLEMISMGSSTVPEELIARLIRAFPCSAVKESYGLTEGGGATRAHPDIATPAGSVGIIAPEYEGKLMDADGNISTKGGELHIRSPYILKAYAGRPELTAQRVYDGWLRTGDLFRMDENGFLFFLGRTDDMFSCGGENIYPKDVENLVLRHPDVSDVIVVPLPHHTKGFAPAAMVTARRGRTVEPSAVQDFCAANGPSFAIPRGVLVVDDLPRTGAGKPDRKVALDMLSATFGMLPSSGGRERIAS
jgi:acyl-CoA synthetase (AMP-forming)/AMP-acid ligase II